MATWDALWDRAKTGVTLGFGPIALTVRASHRRRVSDNGRRRRRAALNAWVSSGVLSLDRTTRDQLDQFAERPSSANARDLNDHSSQLAMIVGVGPGIGTALARRLAKAGMDVALASRQIDKLLSLVDECCALGRIAISYGCDASDIRSVEKMFRCLREDVGSPHLVVYNCEAFGPGGILETTPLAFERSWRVNCFGAFLVARAALPAMLARGSGTIIFIGPTGSLRGRKGYANLAVGKSGARMLAQSMAREFGPQGIHVAHVVIDGPVLTPMNADVVEERGVDGLLSPDAVAETLYQLHIQHKTAWTHELDLRPSVEPF